jgi:transcriptional regulator with XRE-family HTH domain
MGQWYAYRNKAVKPIRHTLRNQFRFHLDYQWLMEKEPSHPNFIRAWRTKRHLSLRGLANLMDDSNGDERISYASLQRYETGEQECTVTMLAAIARALDVKPWMLLEMHPDQGGEVVDLFTKLRPDQRRQATAILKALAEAP